MINILDPKSYIFINEYYAIHFYQMKPIIKYYLIKTIICNMYIILYVMCYIYIYTHTHTHTHTYIYNVLFILYFMLKNIRFIFIFCCKHL